MEDGSIFVWTRKDMLLMDKALSMFLRHIGKDDPKHRHIECIRTNIARKLFKDKAWKREGIDYA